MPKPAQAPSRRPGSREPVEAASRADASDGAPRVQKLLAAAGLGSRREIERWVAAGRVTLRGSSAQLGDRVRPGDTLALDGRPLALPQGRASARVLLYHKPQGELVTRSDPLGRRSVFEHLPLLRQGRWVAVGRLDANTSGLLLFTDSGELAHRLLHPSSGLEREYAVRVLGELSRDAWSRLLRGIRLEDGPARFLRLDESGPPKAESANRWYRAVIGEGRKREVRRLFQAVGARVSRLIRIRFGPVRLPRDLRPGRWVELDEAAVRELAGTSVADGLSGTGKTC